MDQVIEKGVQRLLDGLGTRVSDGRDGYCVGVCADKVLPALSEQMI